MISGGQKLVKMMIALALLTSIVIGCKKDDATPIVIPPGGKVSFQTGEFLYYSDDQYQVYLRNVGENNLELKTIIELTPGKDEILDAEKIHSTIMPKGIIAEGSLVLQVTLDYFVMKLYAMVFSEDIYKPNLQTTLVYNLLSNYPNKSIKSYKKDEVEEIQEYVNNFYKQRIEDFGIDEVKVGPELVYKFMRNGLANNVEFFHLLEKFGIQFNYNADGDILSAPYPFGAPNNAPQLDKLASTPPGTVPGKETFGLSVKVEARDPDGDMLFYVWRKDGEIVAKNLQEFYWMPGFKDGRPEPWPIDAYVSDGGKVLAVHWDMLISDYNRRPVIKGLCATELVEEVLWYCELEAEDPDEDPLMWTAEDGGYSRKPKLEGMDFPATAPGNKIRVEWKPDNKDAKALGGSIVLKVDDGKNGFAFRIISVTIIDINSPPRLVGDGIIPTNPNHLVPHEWDYGCRNADPDGVGEFTFKIEVTDPDNDAGATPPDNVVAVANLAAAPPGIAEVGTNPVVTPGKFTFNYRWRPDHMKLSGSLWFTLADDHGGASDPIEVVLSAEDRNQLACGPTLGGGMDFVDESISTRDYAFTATDKDIIAPHYSPADVAYIQIHSVPLKLGPFLKQCGTANGVPLSQKFWETTPSFGKSATTGLCVRGHYSSQFAGYVTFQRAVPYSSDITIPAGYQIQSPYLVGGNRFQFAVAQDVVMSANDKLVLVPVNPINRTVRSGRLNQIIASPNAAWTVNNLTDITDVMQTADVTIYRPVGAAGVLETIPTGLVLKSDPSALPTDPTAEFEVARDYNFNIGSTSQVVRVKRKAIKVPAGTVTQVVAGLPDASLTVTNQDEVYDTLGHNFATYKGTGNTMNVDKFCFYGRAYDGALAKANAINQIVSVLSDPTVTVSNPSQFQFDGNVVFSRPSSGAAVNIPAGTMVKTRSGLKYTVAADVALAASDTSVTAVVARVMDQALPTGVGTQACLRWKDYNNAATIITASPNYYPETAKVIAHSIEVTDNPGPPADNPLFAKDPGDRYQVTAVPNPTPQGTYMTCRNPGTNLTDINDPPCEPCTNIAGKTHDQTRFCYLRFFPNPFDINETFIFSISAADNGVVWGGSNTAGGGALFKFQEANDPFYLTDNTFTAFPDTTMGKSLLNPIDVGTATEGVKTSFLSYAFDTDKDTSFNDVVWGVEPTYPIKIWDRMPGGTQNQTGFRTTMLVSTANQDVVATPPATGRKNVYQLDWTPTDEDVKKYSSNEGIVIEQKVYDYPTSPSNSMQAFYRLKVTNVNNPPRIGPIGATDNTFTIVADQYWSQTFEVTDKDWASPSAPGPTTFQTKLNLCETLSGAYNRNVKAGDPVWTAPDPIPFDCHATTNGWNDIVADFDAAYDASGMAAVCQDSVDPSKPNKDLAVPKFTLISAAGFGADFIKYTYKVEWCPQKGHLGKHVGSLVVTDNGDMARNGVLAPKASGGAPLTITVQAPVFFVSPKMDPTRTITLHAMKQTATAPGLPTSFRYETIVNNSKNHPLLYEFAPAPYVPPTGIAINSTTGVITWQPTMGQLTNHFDSNTWHTIKIKVTDTVVPTESDTAQFKLEVQDALTYVEHLPTLTKAPGDTGDPIYVDEGETYTFDVVGTDADTSDPMVPDVLHYRWYVDDKITYDQGPSFAWRPDSDAASKVLWDGLAGKHKIKCEVTDGNGVASVTFNVQVRNTIMLTEQVFDVYQKYASARNVVWQVENPIHTVGATGDNEDYLVFAGQWEEFPVMTKRGFVWAQKFTNTAIQPGNNYFDKLPWFTTERLSQYNFMGSTMITLTPQFPRAGPFTVPTDSMKLGFSLAGKSSVAPGDVCLGECAKQHYFGDTGYGRRAEAMYLGNGSVRHLFWADDTGKKLYWDREGLSATLVQDFGSHTIWGIAVNPTLKRAYVTTQNRGPKEYRLWVFDIAPVDVPSPPTPVGGVNNFVSLVDGVPGNEDSYPTEVAVDPTSGRVFALLVGTGGIAVFSDAAGNTPDAGDVVFEGVDDLTSSKADTVRSGKKLVWDNSKKVLVGVSKAGGQVFVFDPTALPPKKKMNISATAALVDAIVNYDITGMTLFVDRDSAKVHIGK